MFLKCQFSTLFFALLFSQFLFEVSGMRKKFEIAHKYSQSQRKRAQEKAAHLPQSSTRGGPSGYQKHSNLALKANPNDKNELAPSISKAEDEFYQKGQWPVQSQSNSEAFIPTRNSDSQQLLGLESSVVLSLDVVFADNVLADIEGMVKSFSLIVRDRKKDVCQVLHSERMKQKFNELIENVKGSEMGEFIQNLVDKFNNQIANTESCVTDLMYFRVLLEIGDRICKKLEEILPPEKIRKVSYRNKFANLSNKILDWFQKKQKKEGKEGKEVQIAEKYAEFTNSQISTIEIHIEKDLDGDLSLAGLEGVEGGQQVGVGEEARGKAAMGKKGGRHGKMQRKMPKKGVQFHPYLPDYRARKAGNSRGINQLMASDKVRRMQVENSSDEEEEDDGFFQQNGMPWHGRRGRKKQKMKALSEIGWTMPSRAVDQRTGEQASAGNAPSFGLMPMDLGDGEVGDEEPVQVLGQVRTDGPPSSDADNGGTSGFGLQN